MWEGSINYYYYRHGHTECWFALSSPNEFMVEMTFEPERIAQVILKQLMNYFCNCSQEIEFGIHKAPATEK